jgi:hypothetical protein
MLVLLIATIAISQSIFHIHFKLLAHLKVVNLEEAWILNIHSYTRLLVYIYIYIYIYIYSNYYRFKQHNYGCYSSNNDNDEPVELLPNLKG